MYAEKNAASGITFTYLGGPTGILEYGGLRFLIDPTFDDAQTYSAEAGDTPLVKTRGPALQPDEIGQIDVVLASHHEHEDNLDSRGAEFAMTVPVVLSTPKAGDDLGAPWVGMADWSQRSVGLVDITAVPALHRPARDRGRHRPGGRVRAGRHRASRASTSAATTPPSTKSTRSRRGMHRSASRSCSPARRGFPRSTPP